MGSTEIVGSLVSVRSYLAVEKSDNNRHAAASDFARCLAQRIGQIGGGSRDPPSRHGYLPIEPHALSSPHGTLKQNLFRRRIHFQKHGADSRQLLGKGCFNFQGNYC